MLQPEAATPAIATVAGIGCQIVARWARVPAIVPLLLVGVVLGPHGFGVVDPSVLGSGLRVLIAFAVATILFEGGLSLKAESLRLAGAAARNLVLVGAFITWGLSSLAAWLLFPELGTGLAVLFGALVIVTGPTVIGPLLATIRPSPKVAAVLRSEAILVDPLGAILAAATLEFLLHEGGEGPSTALAAFGIRILVGFVVGAAGTGLLILALRGRHTLSRDLRPVATFATAIGGYTVSEAIVPESGVLAATLGGLFLGRVAPKGLDEIEAFKGHLTVLMVSIVFILLSASLPLDDVLALGVRGPLLVAALVFVVRPLKVFACGIGSGLSLREKLFVSWIGPRGIVAASVSILFAIVLEEHGVGAGRSLVAMVYSVVFGTVVLQGMTAGWMGRILRISDPWPRGFAIVGANAFGRAIGRALVLLGCPVVLVDRSESNVERAQAEGLAARCGDVLDDDLIDTVDFSGVGHLLALTPNAHINRHAVRAFEPLVGEGRARAILVRSGRVPGGADVTPPLFGDRLGFEECEHALHHGATIEVADIDMSVDVDRLPEIIPGAQALFVLDASGRARWLDRGDLSLGRGEIVVYLSPPESIEQEREP